MERILISETIKKTGESVTVKGWVSVRRDHGKIIFIDLRDRSGILQIVFTPSEKEVYEIASRLRQEWVIAVVGKIAERPKGMQNSEIETGQIELQAENIEVLNEAQTPPFPLDTGGLDIEEAVRLKYRYLDLRRERLQKNIILRSRVVLLFRQFLHERGFYEIETPLLTKATPEGSRDFLVPSRLQPGKFYALPQSPQQYKQLLMVAGFEKYFQVARALRDEDLRSDRGFEHSQIDLEMSFVEREDVMRLVEEVVLFVAESIGKTVTQKPFPRFTYAEALQKFNADKFDMRDADKKNTLAFAWVTDFPVFEKDKEGKWTYSHNPFTAPRKEDEENLLAGKNIGSIVSQQYDLVCNGHEIGGGGIRIHKAELLEKVFEIIGHKKEDIEKQFGHMLDALRYGAPPHGGIALGIERLMMIFAEEEFLREVQAFPTTSNGETSVMQAPSEVDEKQLKELHLKILK
ncbi:aspartate--tRNA ligase [Patescibacteria group bacterium]|nr:aspartate--tRNA ligase [Patescibacteria group bacterium]